MKRFTKVFSKRVIEEVTDVVDEVDEVDDLALDSYVIGLREWHQRYGESRDHARYNFIGALVTLTITLIAVFGALYVSNRPQIVAHVVDLEKFVTVYETAYDTTSLYAIIETNQQRAAIYRFLLATRRVTPDLVIHRHMQQELAALIIEDTQIAKQLKNMFAEYDRQTLALTHSVRIDIREFRRTAVDTYYVRWNEIHAPLTGGASYEIQQTGTFTLARSRVTNNEALFNPSGVVVTHFTIHDEEA